MRDVTQIDPSEYAGTEAVIEFTYLGSKKVWVGLSGNPVTRLTKIQTALQRGKDPVDYVPRDLLRSRGQSAILVKLTVCSREHDIDHLYDAIRNEHSRANRLGGQRRAAELRKYYVYSVRHPELSDVIYFGVFGNGNIIRAKNVFRQRAKRLVGYTGKCRPGSLAELMRDRTEAFSDGFVATLVGDGRPHTTAEAARAYVKVNCRAQVAFGINVLNRGF